MEQAEPAPLFFQALEQAEPAPLFFQALEQAEPAPLFFQALEQAEPAPLFFQTLEIHAAIGGNAVGTPRLRGESEVHGGEIGFP